MEPETFDPDEAVAKGAALFGLKESLQDEVFEILNAGEANKEYRNAPINVSDGRRTAGFRGAR